MFIKVENLTKVFKVPVRTSGLKATLKQLFKRTYKEVKAVDNLSFTIKKGEFVGYLGPNGAGKSTTIKMLTGILVPDSGILSVDNIIPHKSRIKYSSKIGVVFGQKSQLWWDLPLIESFELLKAIYKIPKDLYEKHYAWLINGLNIEVFINRPVRLLSLGQRMRAELVASLLHMPEILFLDEPTIGLDATSKQLVRKFLLILNKEYGTTIILTTHDMDDIEALCSRVMVIDNGNLAFDGSISALRSRVHNKKRVTVEYLGLWDKETLPEIEILEVKNNKLLFEFDPVKISPTLVVKWLAEKIEIKDLVIENPPIEEIISRLYGQLS